MQPFACLFPTPKTIVKIFALMQNMKKGTKLFSGRIDEGMFLHSYLEFLFELCGLS
jgi:hypothetical protein